MKASVYKSGLLALLTAALLIPAAISQEVTKEFHKEYKADINSALDISNRYGDVVITGWDNDQIVIHVKVTVEMPDKARAEKLLSLIDVQFTEGSNSFAAKTVISDDFNFRGWGSGKRFSIDYSVKMPYAIALTLANRYGNTDIDELRGLTNIDVKYGNLNIDKLLRGNEKPVNKISVSYGKATIDQAGWLDLYARYAGSVTITKSQALLIDSRYSTVKIGETSSIVADTKYDKLEVQKINNLVVVAAYTSVQVFELGRKLNAEGSYGSLTVERIPEGFESAEVDVRYMGVRLGIVPEASYRLEGNSSYGGIKYNEESFRFEKKIIQNTSSEVAGVVGKESSPKSTVKVTTAYGTVRLI